MLPCSHAKEHDCRLRIQLELLRRLFVAAFADGGRDGVTDKRELCVALALAASKSKFYQAKKGFELLPWVAGVAGVAGGVQVRVRVQARVRALDRNGVKCYSRAFQVALPAAFRRGHQNLLAAGAAFCSALVYTLVTRTYLQLSI